MTEVYSIEKKLKTMVFNFLQDIMDSTEAKEIREDKVTIIILDVIYNVI